MNDAQKKLFIDNVLRTHAGFTPAQLFPRADMADAFFAAVVKHKNATSKNLNDMKTALMTMHQPATG
ncbi:hypothetical protein KA478_03995 [Patescibacteria group bacterium]|nr:hypothetical protein [Patescibacteria group bacterium]